MFLYIFLSAILIMSASLVGVLFVGRHLSGLFEKNLKILIAFSMGVFSVVSYSLLAETLELGITPYILIISTIAGALFLEVMSRIIPRAHHHHEPDRGHKHSRRDAHRMLLGDAVHNISDGIILVPAFVANIWLGVATAFGIFLHELVQEIAEFFVLKEAGYSTAEALIRNFLVSGTILVGIVLTILISSIESFKALLLSFAAGGFLYIIFRDLLPSIIRSIKMRGKAHHFVIATLLGAGMMAGVGAIAPESHGTLSEQAPGQHSEIE